MHDSLCAIKTRKRTLLPCMILCVLLKQKKNATSMHDSLCAIKTEKDTVNVLFSCAIKVTDNKRRYIDAMFSLCY